MSLGAPGGRKAAALLGRDRGAAGAAGTWRDAREAAVKGGAEGVAAVVWISEWTIGLF